MKEAVCSAHFLSKASMPAGIMTLAIAVALPQNGSLVALKKDAKIAAFDGRSTLLGASTCRGQDQPAYQYSNCSLSKLLKVSK